jgi:HEAT repeat protein
LKKQQPNRAKVRYRIDIHKLSRFKLVAFVVLALVCAGFHWPGRLSRLRGELQSSDAQERREAIALLGDYPADQVREVLLKALEDDDLGVRIEAAKAAQRVGVREAVPVLTRWLEGPDTEARAVAALAIAKLGGAAVVEALIPLLADAQPAVRAAAIEAVEETGTVKAAVALRKQLGKAAADDRILIICALARLRDTRSLEEMIRASRDSSPEMRVAAVQALGEVGDNRAAPVLIKGLNDQVESVRLAAAAALGRRRPTGAIAALSKRLSNADARLGEAVVAALGWFSVPQARKLLVLQLQNPALHQAAADALAAQTERATIEAIQAEADAARGVPTGVLSQSPAQTALVTANKATEKPLQKPASEEEAETLLAQIESARGQQLHHLLAALGDTLGQLRRANRIETRLAAKARGALVRYVQGHDRFVAARAIAALAAWGDAAAAPIVAPLIDRSPTTRAIAATYALASFDLPDVRTLLRLRLRSEVTKAAAAAMALGELGSRRDGPRLVRAAEQSGHWPMPASALYGVVRLARRGVLEKADLRQALCRAGTSKDPYLRANLAVAMAYLHAGGCANGPDPIEWLGSGHTPVVRAAAARWAYSAAVSGELPAETVRQALLACYLRDPEPLVASACLLPQLPRDNQTLDVTAYAADRRTLLSFYTVALRQADSSVFIGYTDLNGHLPIRSAPQGTLLLEDPAVMPLEP